MTPPARARPVPPGRVALGALAIVLMAGGLGLRWGLSGGARPWAELRRDPEDPARWLRWAKELEGRGGSEAVDRALSAYRVARVLGEPTGQAALRLGFLLYAREQDEEAEVLLREALARGQEPALVAFTLAAIRARRSRGTAERTPEPHGVEAAPTERSPAPVGRAPPEEATAAPRPRVETAAAPSAPLDAGVGEAPAAPCTLDLVRVGGGLGVELHIEGEPTVLLFDTGASSTLLTEALARRVGATPDRSVVFRASTANGRVELPTAEFFDVELAGRRADLGRVAVCERCLEGLDEVGGLFGLDLQRAFGVELDLESDQLRFRDCP